MNILMFNVFRDTHHGNDRGYALCGILLYPLVSQIFFVAGIKASLCKFIADELFQLWCRLSVV